MLGAPKRRLGISLYFHTRRSSLNLRDYQNLERVQTLKGKHDNLPQYSGSMKQVHDRYSEEQGYSNGNPSGAC
jgi:hypothetical protein